MAFLLPILEGAGAGLLGNGISSILGGATGNAENGAMNALNTQDETFQLGMYASEVQDHVHGRDSRSVARRGAAT